MKKMVPVMAMVCLASSAMSLERTAITASDGANGAERMRSETLSAMVSALGERVTRIISCNSDGKLYAPNDAAADGNGCVSAESSTPVSTVAFFAQNSCPDGWLEANGQSTSGRAELAAAVGSNVPDLRGEFIRGLDNGRGVDAGRFLGTSQLDQMQRITGKVGRFAPIYAYIKHSASGAFHDVESSHTYHRADNYRTAIYMDVFFDSANSENARVGDETRPRNVALLPCIKY